MQKIKGKKGSKKKGRKSTISTPLHAQKLYDNARKISERKKATQEMYVEAEMEYMERHKFATNRRTREMAERRESVVLMGFGGNNNNNNNNSNDELVTTLDATDNNTNNGINGIVPRDVGSRLYIQAHIRKQRVDQLARTSEIRRLEDEMKDCTFQPVLSKGSNDIERFNKHGNIYDALYADDEIHRERAEAYVGRASEP